MQIRNIFVLCLWMLLNSTSASDLFCGSERYDPKNAFCCGQQIHKKFQNSREMACCTRSGKEDVYPKDEKICCGEQLVQQYDRNLKCCNKELINSTKHDCCGDRDFGVKYTFDQDCCVNWNKKTFGVYQFKEHSSCCGSLQYNKDEEECKHGPEGYSVEKISFMRACGKEQYDSSISLCCKKTGKVIPIPVEDGGVLPSEWVCWNDRPYDRRKYYLDHRTSRVILNGLALCGDDVYSRNHKSIKCCGKTLFSVTPEMNTSCCGNKLWDLDDNTKKCCSDKFIDTATHDCCDNQPFKVGYDQQCCGRSLYSKTKDICCQTQSSEMTVISKKLPTHTNCCRSIETGRITTYNKYMEVCEKGVISERTQRDETRVISTDKNPTPPERKQCPFCSPVIDFAACSKRQVYRFFVYDTRKTKHGTILNGVILEPLKKSGAELNGKKIKIRTRTKCGCFKPRRNFYLITNRKIKSFQRDRLNVRFTTEDVFIQENDTESLATCRTYQTTYNSKRNGL